MDKKKNKTLKSIETINQQPIFFLVSKGDLEIVNDCIVTAGSSLSERIDDILKIRKLVLGNDGKEYVFLDSSGNSISPLNPHMKTSIVLCPDGQRIGTAKRVVFRVDTQSDPHASFIAFLESFEQHLGSMAYKSAYGDQKPVEWRNLLEKEYIAIQLEGDFIPLKERQKIKDDTPEGVFFTLQSEYNSCDNATIVETKISVAENFANLTQLNEEIFDEIIGIANFEELDRYFEKFSSFTYENKCAFYEWIDEWVDKNAEIPILDKVVYLCWRGFNADADIKTKKNQLNRYHFLNKESLQQELRTLRSEQISKNKIYTLFNALLTVVNSVQEKDTCDEDEKNANQFYAILEVKDSYAKNTLLSEDANKKLTKQLLHFLLKNGFVVRSQGDIVRSLCVVACLASDANTENISKCYQNIASEVQKTYPSPDELQRIVVRNSNTEIGVVRKLDVEIGSLLKQFLQKFRS